jgi:hypothetical protein
MVPMARPDGHHGARGHLPAGPHEGAAACGGGAGGSPGNYPAGPGSAAANYTSPNEAGGCLQSAAGKPAGRGGEPGIRGPATVRGGPRSLSSFPALGLGGG